jgi:hypothetical protein
MAEPAPWDDLADAFERLDDARRHGTADELAAAERDAARARDRLAALGELLLSAAIREPSALLQKRVRDVFGLDAALAWDHAQQACDLARRLLAKVDALTQRLAELEDAVADLTPGIGVPQGLRVFGSR